LPSTPSRRELRKRYRHARRELAPTLQIEHAKRVARLVAASGLLLLGKRFAAYAANDGELDPAPLVHLLTRAHKTVWLPVMGREKRLTWRRVQLADRLVRNRVGIAEPSAGAAYVPSTALDVVFVPLVAFDDAGHRLGRGGGHYDATFAPLARRPLLVGLAHELQHAHELPHERWDAPLDAVITEQRVYGYSARARSFATKPLSHALQGDT